MMITITTAVVVDPEGVQTVGSGTAAGRISLPLTEGTNRPASTDQAVVPSAPSQVIVAHLDVWGNVHHRTPIVAARIT